MSLLNWKLETVTSVSIKIQINTCKMRKEIKIEKVKHKIKKLKFGKQEMEPLRYDIKVNIQNINRAIGQSRIFLRKGVYRKESNIFH